MTGFAIFLMVAAMVITLGIVFAGVISMARGGEFNQKWANKLMRARVVMQLFALVMFVFAVYLLRNGG
ncbi:twin transmembrane helix small protein [Marivibrio halodurans]|uniref:Twin transmembrane helix small protein n=1 Tax=Marivibrio halodurans TaxID=2039722 RepID=A0A8J7SBL7_9PROT|nr:twin transmembrane helix small protein [Marivibrio halodurans]MBP5859027.1 twin transmembrane helix small protein [Marivibrio halodurans]